MSCDNQEPPTEKRKVTNKVFLNAHDKKVFDILLTYFERDPDSNKVHCLVRDCKTTISRWQLYYFKRHFEFKHRSLLNELFPEELSYKQQMEIAVCELISNAVELVTINGSPFSILDASSLKGMLNPHLKELEQNGYKVTINRHMIAQKISEVSQKVQSQIGAELKSKMISIMFDVCTKRTFSVLGVSATTMINDAVIGRSLGMIQLKERHRGPYLADVVENLLKEYEISLRQIYSGTADKATNMDNTVRNISLRACNELEQNQNPLEQSNGGNDEEVYESASEGDDEMCMDLENQIELHNELNNENRYVELVNDMTQHLSRRANFLSPVQKIHCCAHTTQLAVNSALNQSEAKEIVSTVREMMKMLRTTVVNIEFRKIAPNCILPRLHVETRWNSDYEMVRFIA